MNEVVADVFRDESASSAQQIQPLDLISLAIEDVTHDEHERARLRKLYAEGGFDGRELEVQNEHEARELVKNELVKLRGE